MRRDRIGSAIATSGGAGRKQGKLIHNFSLLQPEQTPSVSVLQMWRNPPVLPTMGHVMSPILPISFVATLLCVLVAIDWALYQQILFVGAALSATVWVCALEAWSCQEAPVRSNDESHGHSAGE
jgi:hypothetical protein